MYEFINIFWIWWTQDHRNVHKVEFDICANQGINLLAWLQIPDFYHQELVSSNRFFVLISKISSQAHISNYLHIIIIG